MPTVSVVIPTFNRKELLLECLESVDRQELRPNEIVIVDDGSTDGTREVLDGREDLKIVLQQNEGPGAARNRGAGEATSDYLAFLDSDDLWFPWSLKVMVELLERHEPLVLFGRFEDFRDQPKASYAIAQGEAFSCFLATAGQGVFAGAGMFLIERKTFLSVGGFCEDGLNAEDHDLALRLGDAAGFVQVKSPVTVAHRMHASNEMKDAGSNLAGLARLVRRERNGEYPGGRLWQHARREIIAMHLRPQILSAANTEYYAQAWNLFRSTVTWAFSARRIPYIVSVCVRVLRANTRARSLSRQTDETAVH